MNTNAYHCLIALLWSETDDNGEPLDNGEHQPSPELIAKIDMNWTAFRYVLSTELAGFDPEEELATMLHPDCDGDAWNAVAHDFILTRNGHGTGFWDGRWHKPWGDRLTTIAKRFGPIETYVGDDGLIYA